MSANIKIPIRTVLTIVIANGLIVGCEFIKGGNDPEYKVHVLSNRNNMISGGDALVEIVTDRNRQLAEIDIFLNRRDVSSSFAIRPNGRYMGLVKGLKDGKNTLTVSSSNNTKEVTLTNYPIGGPIFSGPHVQPWLCETESAGLGQAKDEKCNAPKKVEYLYMPSGPTEAGFLPYNTVNPPDDVAITLTDQGKKVPFIVRVETGTVNRGIYEYAVLHDPSKSVTPWDPDLIWNNKVYYYFTGGAGYYHGQGSPILIKRLINLKLSKPHELEYVSANGWVVENKPLQLGYALSQGWVVATSTLNSPAYNTNPVTSAETLMMVKEIITERMGEIRYTMSEGCSGGSLAQHSIAELYPGLLDGIQPQCAGPDMVMAYVLANHCSLIHNVFEDSPGRWSNPLEQATVSGNPDPRDAPAKQLGTCKTFHVANIADAWINPTNNCMSGVTNAGSQVHSREAEWVYHPIKNPKGVRCTLQDYQINTYGKRKSSAWGETEKTIGQGFANRPFDNVGIQYGLQALQTGKITPEQFVELNMRIGGYDIDGNWQKSRSGADIPALRAAYRGNTVYGKQLAKVPIIDLRGTENYGVHPDFVSYTIRARLDAANGHHENQVIWVGRRDDYSAYPTHKMARASFNLLDQWLSNIENDRSDDPIEAKVRRNKPDEAMDACWVNGKKVVDRALCRKEFPIYGAPRIAAGSPISSDILKCKLKPLKRSDYAVRFTDEQWKKLKNTFSTGVCDWSVAGVAQQQTIPWLDYSDGAGGKSRLEINHGIE